MRLAKLTMSKLFFLFIAITTAPFFATAQENSPFSRYGIGDLVPNQNSTSRAMGGITAGFQDNLGVNFSNPASFAGLGLTTFDIGSEISSRTLKSQNPVQKYKANNVLVNYVTLAFPLTTEKMLKKNMRWAMSFGLRPISRINYKIEQAKRLTNIDSLNYLYEGQGGINQFYFATAFAKKNFSIGASSGFLFGNKQYETRLSFVNDTTEYYSALQKINTQANGLFLNVGTQYTIPFKKGANLRLGAYANLQTKLSTSQDVEKITFGVAVGNPDPIELDSIFKERNTPGKMTLPAQYGVGFTYTSQHWLVGADVEHTAWNNYRFNGSTDQVQNVTKLRVGLQYYPADSITSVKKYWSFVKYRAGFYYGPDYIKLSSKRNDFGFTAGLGLPLTSLIRYSSYNTDLVLLNAGIEMGSRGDLKVDNLKENYTRFTIGISMNARWFIKRRYD
jgi:hypothetical protein